MTRNDGRLLEILLQVFALCPRFVGQPFQQSSEWSDIISKSFGGPVGDFFLGEDPGSLRLVKVGGVFLNLLA